MRLGFVGVGRWAQKLKAAFEAEGAHIGAACRADGSIPEGWGVYTKWPAMIESKLIDALVLCAPPEVTTEVALACAAAGKPVMATKPLMLEQPVPIRAPFYVDFWRLWSETWGRLNNYALEFGARKLSVSFNGSGPYRSFPGLLDYGPHAAAFIRTFRKGRYIIKVKEATLVASDTSGGECFSCRYDFDDSFLVGNSARPNSSRSVLLDAGPSGLMQWGEEPEGIRLWGPNSEGRWDVLASEDKFLVLRRMCRSFMNDISEGFVTTEHLDLSCAVMRDLAEVRRLADEGAKR